MGCPLELAILHDGHGLSTAPLEQSRRCWPGEQMGGTHCWDSSVGVHC